MSTLLLYEIISVFFIETFVIAASHCTTSDRQYTCDCIFKTNNESVLAEETDDYNVTEANFMPALKSLHYCQGSFQCKPNFAVSQSPEVINSDNYIICFSDDSCLSNGGFEIASLRGFNEACIKNSCMYLKDLTEFNITNTELEVGAYMCIKVGSEGLKTPYCLKPACKSFVAIEKLCACDYEIQNCKCASYCHNSLAVSSQKTYALFVSFGDIYTTRTSKGSFLHWIILFVLCVGLAILLLIFCRLCNVAFEPACGNEVQNAEILRRILVTNVDSSPPTASTTAKNSFSAPERSSPPPSYEQVLKDKCIEFKKSVA